MTATKHIVIGAGGTGSATAIKLAQRGEDVSVVSRSGSGPQEDGIEIITADATDTDRLTQLTEGATVLYNCANPPYHRWTTDWPPLAASLLTAAQRNDFTLVTLSNLYCYAAPTRAMKVSDPLDPPSIKGGVRANMWREAKAAHDAGHVRVAEARASDFIGPGVGTNGHMGDRVVPRILKGKSVSLVGRTDQAHSWTAIDDVAATLIALGADERAWGRAWHVPTAAPLTQQQLVHRMCELAGVEPVKVKTIPAAFIRAIGIFNAPMRELKEVSYQFERPFVIDSAETTDVLGLTPTPMEDTIDATLSYYRTLAG